MSTNYFFKVNSGKNLKIGTWLLENRYTDDKFRIFSGVFGRHKRLMVYNLGPYHHNSYFAAPIVTNDYPYPINTRSHLNETEQQQLMEVINELLRTRKIRESASLYSSPVRVIQRDGRLEIKMDYTFLNEIVVAREYHIPSHEEIISAIEDSSLFSKIVLKDIYHQYSLFEGDKHKTAFHTDFGKFEFNTLHAGLKNADEYVQEMLDTILSTIDRHSIKIHLDHILVHSTDFYEHMAILTSIFQAFEDANLKIDVEKSNFLMKDLEFLGYRLSNFGISISLENIELIRNTPAPRNLAELKAFLKLTDKFKSHIEDYENLMKPLIKLAGTRIGFYWNREEQVTFDDVKRKLIDSPSIQFKQRFYFYEVMLDPESPISA